MLKKKKQKGKVNLSSIYGNKCSEYRKVVVLFSADQTTAKIKSSTQESMIQEKYGGKPQEQKESGNTHKTSTEGIQEDWPEEENKRKQTKSQQVKESVKLWYFYPQSQGSYAEIRGKCIIG